MCICWCLHIVIIQNARTELHETHVDYFLTYFCILEMSATNLCSFQMKHYLERHFSYFSNVQERKEVPLPGRVFLQFYILFGHSVCSWHIENIHFFFKLIISTKNIRQSVIKCVTFLFENPIPYTLYFALHINTVQHALSCTVNISKISDVNKSYFEYHV
jgi:hypothetical protein